MKKALEWLDVERRAAEDNPSFTTAWLNLVHWLARLGSECLEAQQIWSELCEPPPAAVIDGEGASVSALRDTIKEALLVVSDMVLLMPNLLGDLGTPDWILADLFAHPHGQKAALPQDARAAVSGAAQDAGTLGKAILNLLDDERPEALVAVLLLTARFLFSATSGLARLHGFAETASEIGPASGPESQ